MPRRGVRVESGVFVAQVIRLSCSARSGERSLREEQIMPTPTTQQVVDYLKSHPDVAKRAMDYVKSHPGDAKAAFKEIASERGWDLSQIDTTALTKELGNIIPH